MPDIELLLEPISEEKPSGEDLKYFKAPLDQVPLFDKIRNARKMEDTGPMGKWERESTPSDFGLVAKWTSDALTTKTKDLQLAAWLTEAWIYKDGVKGLISGLDLCRELLNRFWDTLYPELDEGDAEPRSVNLDWIGSYFDPAKGSSPIFALRSVPLTSGGYSWFNYQESRTIGYEAEVNSNPARKAFRAAAIKDGKVIPEVFDKDFEGTKKAVYKELEADLKAALVSLTELDSVCHEKFQDVAPSFTPLRKAIEEVSNVVHILLLKKLQKEPDPVEPEPQAEAAAEEGAEDAQEETPAAGQSPQQIDLSQLESGAIKNEAQAILHVVAAAQYIRRQTPASPASYLLLRALRWGELRGAPDVKQADLPAPQAEVRKSLRTAAAGNNWKAVLEAAEGAMGNPCGRGWLDLQRYAIRATTELGYAAAAKAIRSELKSLLVDFPELTKATLNDDTGAANPETLDWLKQEGLMA
jgi:type VI secretion system protein ImpA